MPITGPEPGCLSAGKGPVRAPLLASELCLRPLRQEDAAAIQELASEREVAENTARIPHPYPDDGAATFVKAANEATITGHETVLAIERIADHRLVGCIGYILTGADAEVGYWIGRPYWGTGYGTEALRRLIRHLFLDRDAQTLYASVMPHNAASSRVVEKAGFHRAGQVEGHLGRTMGKLMDRWNIDRDTWMAGWLARPTLLVSAVAMVDGDGRVLLTRRPEGRSMAGLWEFPGGKVDAGETPVAALIRELHEELGVDVSESCLAPLVFASHDYETFHLLMPVYACRVWKGEPQGREGQSLKWMRPVAMADLPMPPADIPLVPLLRDFL